MEAQTSSNADTVCVIKIIPTAINPLSTKPLSEKSKVFFTVPRNSYSNMFFAGLFKFPDFILFV